jgi:hypothetical protein
MAESSVTQPQIFDGPADLQTLATRALMQYGDFAPGAVHGEVILMFIDLANEVIDDIRSHPYWDGSALSYYRHQTDRRPIPDNLIIAGLLAKYSVQQASEKAGIRVSLYVSTLNKLLWYKLNGNGPIALSVMDEGSGNDRLYAGTTDIQT